MSKVFENEQNIIMTSEENIQKFVKIQIIKSTEILPHKWSQYLG